MEIISILSFFNRVEHKKALKYYSEFIEAVKYFMPACSIQKSEYESELEIKKIYTSNSNLLDFRIKIESFKYKISAEESLYIAPIILGKERPVFEESLYDFYSNYFYHLRYKLSITQIVNVKSAYTDTRIIIKKDYHSVKKCLEELINTYKSTEIYEITKSNYYMELI